MADSTVENPAGDIQASREQICTAFLLTIAVIAVPALIASLLRIREIGWQPVMGLHLVLAAALWSITLFRQRIAYALKAGFIVLLFCLVGIGGILQFGLVAGGVAFLVVAAPVATLLFGGRVGFTVLAVLFASAMLVGLLYISGYLLVRVDLARYAVAPSAWVTSLTGWLLASAALTASLYVFNRNLIGALRASRRQEAILRKQRKELQEVIEEKERALSEIRTLHGIIPICSYCHKIRNDEGAWSRLESYICEHSEAQFSHGICPSCLEKVKKEEGLDTGDS